MKFENPIRPVELTTTERDALVAVEGMVISNTTTGTLEYYNGTIWNNISSPAASDVSTPNDGVSIHTNNVEKFMNHIWSSSSVDGLDLTDNTDGTVTIAAGEVVLRPTDTHDGQLKGYAIATATSGTDFAALSDNEQNFVYVQYNGGAPNLNVTTDPVSIDGRTETPIYVITRVGTSVHSVDLRTYTTDFMHLESRKEFFTKGFSHEIGGSILTEVGIRNIVLTSGAFYLTSRRIPHTGFNTQGADSFTSYYTSNFGGSWVRTAGQTQIDNLQYNDISTGLVTLPNNKFAVAWVFVVLNDTDFLAVVYGQASYANVSAANSAKLPSILPPEMQAYSTGQLVAKIVFEKNAATFSNIQNPFEEQLADATATIHNGLGGLQGGIANEYYHITSAQNTLVSNLVQNNLIAIIAPAASDSSAGGYAVGSVWIDTVTDKAYICLDSTVAAAVWKDITQTGGGGAWEPPTVNMGDGSTIGVSVFINDDNIGKYYSFSGTADDVISFVWSLKHDEVQYDGSDLAIDIFGRISANGGVGDTIGWILEYHFVKNGDLLTAGGTTEAQVNYDVSTELLNVGFTKTLNTMTGVVGATDLFVTITRNAAGAGQDGFSGAMEVQGICINKV